MDEQEPSEILLNQIVNGYIGVSRCRKWFDNLKLSSCASGLTQEYLSQATFSCFVLNYIHSEARNILPSPKCNSQKNVDSELSTQFGAQAVQSAKQPSAHWENDYTLNFPPLNETASKKEAQKSKRRINPTPISSEELSKHKLASTKKPGIQFPDKKSEIPLTGREELLSKRLYLIDSNKKRRNNASSHQNSETTDEVTYITEEKMIKLRRLGEIYSLLFDYYLVNVTTELKFLLNVFSILCEHDVKHLKQNHDQTKDSRCRVLSSAYDWLFFCKIVFISQINLLSKLEFITRNYIVDKMKNFFENHKKFPKDQNFDSSIKMLLHNENVHYNLNLLSNFTISNKAEPEFSSEEEENKYNKGRHEFLEHRSNASTKKDIIPDFSFLNLFNSSINLHYFFGQLFVDCLILTIQESAKCKTDETQKRNQLNFRLIQPLSSDPDNENFMISELFYKDVIDYCAIHHPDYIIYIRYWLYNKILELSNQPQDEIDDSIPIDQRNSLLFDVKIKIALGKLLGYIDFFHRRLSKELNEVEKDILLKIYSEMEPPTDIKSLLIKSFKTGCVTLTIPWIIQYLTMIDNISISSPYYHDMIFILMSYYVSNLHQTNDMESSRLCEISKTKNVVLKLSVIIPSRNNEDLDDTIYSEGIYLYIKKSSAIFIKIWITKFFESRNIGDGMFFKFLETYISKLSFIKYKGSCKRCIDCIELIDHFAYNLVCPHFNKMKYWENSNPGVIKNVRPLQLASEREDKEQDIQLKMEERFLNDHQNIDSLIKFILSRFSNIFETELEHIINQETEHKKLVPFPNIEDNLSDESKYKIQELLMNFDEKISLTMKCLVPTSLPVSVLDASVCICKRKFDAIMNECISNKGLDKEILSGYTMTKPSDILQGDSKVGPVNRVEETTVCEVDDDYQANMKNSLSALFSQMNIYACDITYNSYEIDEKNIIDIIGNLKKIGELINTDDTKLWNEFCAISWNYVLQMILKVPDFISETTIDEIICIWKKEIVPSNNRILCPRLITPAAQNRKENQQKIALKIGRVITHALRGLLTLKDLEEQCINLLQVTWSKKELDFITVLLSSILDSVPEVLTNDEIFYIRNAVEVVAEAINDMKRLDD